MSTETTSGETALAFEETERVPGDDRRDPRSEPRESRREAAGCPFERDLAVSADSILMPHGRPQADLADKRAAFGTIFLLIDLPRRPRQRPSQRIPDLIKITTLIKRKF